MPVARAAEPRTDESGEPLLLLRAEQCHRGQEILAYAKWLRSGQEERMNEAEAILAACALDAAIERPSRVSRPAKVTSRTPA